MRYSLVKSLLNRRYSYLQPSHAVSPNVNTVSDDPDLGTLMSRHTGRNVSANQKRGGGGGNGRRSVWLSLCRAEEQRVSHLHTFQIHNTDYIVASTS